MSGDKFLFPDAGVRGPLFIKPDGGNPPPLPSWKLKQPVLDHGYVRYIDHMGSDETIVETARMSTQRGFVSWDAYRRCDKCELIWLPLSSREHQPACISGEHSIREFPRGDNGLLETCFSEGHTSPIEMVELHVEVKAPIEVVRQLVRHRTFSMNEMSARYSQMPNEHYVPGAARLQPKTTRNKQESSLKPAEPMTEAVVLDLQHQVAAAQEDTYSDYEFMLSLGVPKETARINTPVSRYTVWRWKTDLHNWFQMTKKRTHKGAQWETQQYAEACENILRGIAPRAYFLYEEHMKYAVTLSRTEVEEVKALLRGKKLMPRELVDSDGEKLSEKLLAKFV